MTTRHLTFSLQDENGKPLVSFGSELTLEAISPHTWRCRDSFDGTEAHGGTPHGALMNWLAERVSTERLL